MATDPSERGGEREIELRWRGPLRIPKLAAAIGDSLADFEMPHVYFSVQEYPGAQQPDMKIVYVGRARDFLKRMLEHYRYFLGFGYWLRNEQGQEIYKVEPKAHLERLDGIDHSILDAVSEAKRISYFCATCQEGDIAAVESALINHVMDRVDRENRVGRENSPPPGLSCDNSRREQNGAEGERLAIIHEAHDDHPETIAYLDLVFGAKRISWGAERG